VGGRKLGWGFSVVVWGIHRPGVLLALFRGDRDAQWRKPLIAVSACSGTEF